VSSSNRTRSWPLAIAGAMALVALLAAAPARPASGVRPSAKGDADEMWATEFARRKAEARARRKGRGKEVHPHVVAAAAPAPVTTPAPPAQGFAPQTRLGFTAGDQWEPSIAADAHGHVYVFYAQYQGVPGCPTCPSPTGVIQVSDDGGATFGPPRPIVPSTGTQFDPQIVVDPLDGATVYAAWLQNDKSLTVVARSDDFGDTWNVSVASRSSLSTDKPILAVRGDDVYVAYSRTNTAYFGASHDGGRTFSTTSVKTGKLGLPLASAGTVLPNGHVVFSFGGYTKSGNATGEVNLFLARSTDGGRTFKTSLVDRSAAAADCPDYLCGYAYLAAQIVVAADDDGTVYALWTAGAVDRGPARAYFARSTDGGATFGPRTEVSSAPQGADHAFPAIVARGRGDVRISWMDAREAAGAGAAAVPAWNVYYRTSTDGGVTWSGEQDLSTPVAGFSYIFAEGFSFPFGDYYELDVDGDGNTHAIFGEGLNYDSPGSIWYTRGR